MPLNLIARIQLFFSFLVFNKACPRKYFDSCPRALNSLIGPFDGFFGKNVQEGGFFLDLSQHPNLVNKVLDVVTVETRQEVFPSYLENILGGPVEIPPAERIIVLRKNDTASTLNKLRHNQRVKTLLLFDFLNKFATLWPDKVVMIVDSDVVWLNCNTNLVDEFHQILGKFSKNEGVIFGAEMNDYASPISGTPWRYPSEHALNFTQYSYLPHLGNMSKFLNAGFMIGTYSSLAKMITSFVHCLFTFTNIHPNMFPQFNKMESCNREYFADEQGIYHHLFLEDYGRENQTIFLDYTQTFLVNQFGLQLDKMFEFHLHTNSRNFASSNLINKTRALPFPLNYFFGLLSSPREICFLHFAGPKEPMRIFLDAMRNHQNFSDSFNLWVYKYSAKVVESIRSVNEMIWSNVSDFTYMNLDPKEKIDNRQKSHIKLGFGISHLLVFPIFFTLSFFMYTLIKCIPNDG